MTEDDLKEQHDGNAEQPEGAIEEEAATPTPVEFEEDQPRQTDEVEDEFDSEMESTEADAEELEETPADDEQAETDDKEPEEAEPGEAVGEDFIVTSESVVEAVLFASDEALTPARLAKIAETGIKQVRQHVKSLNEQYREGGRAFRIERIAGGYQMLTLPEYHDVVGRLFRAKSETRLSQAALETLAIVAYRQPVLRADIEAIRGVATGEVLRGLMEKQLVKIVGRAEVLGRPMLYGTTRRFLEVFGLSNLKELPNVEELRSGARALPAKEASPRAGDDEPAEEAAAEPAEPATADDSEPVPAQEKPADEP